MTPTHLTIDYHHRGCCTQHDGEIVTVQVEIDAESGTYQHRPPYCVYSHLELARAYRKPQVHYAVAGPRLTCPHGVVAQAPTAAECIDLVNETCAPCRSRNTEASRNT